MPVDLKTLKKMESSPASAQSVQRNDGDHLVVLVKLRKGWARPSYVSPRAEMGSEMFSAEVLASDLVRLEADPAVESMSLSRTLPVIE